MTVSNDESPLSLDGSEIHVCQDGPRDAPALLLIHGTAASLRWWDPMVPLLAGSHHVIRIDLLGCGQSAKPDDASYALPDQARQIGAALDRLGIEHAIVVGHSSGSAFATALAEQRPDLVTALAFINFGPNMAAYIAEDIAIEPLQWPHLTDEQLRQMMSSGFRPGYEIPQPYVDHFRDIDLHVFAATSQAIRVYLEEQGLPERLMPLGKPLLVIFGEEDRRWRPCAAAEYRAVPDATIEMLPGVGHSPNIEDPPRTAVPLLTFTANHTQPAT
ncbi:alpha/beta fold hydrolase [Kibdelosporangium aridum]|uniref:Pimeloyl-ACP methyl ester carboxylesterase n=1 Tax=Kibdelosporangium aridum TaxID=2030 RepID=A0A1W2FUB7_KIBAR|nr:alpha/beta hydrolase [Kibdelosporangium aridum]SMD25473.1 Pimeloyl-ACP methyl ester carboxylesterase [Kibdelosporangium aridum]